MNESTILTWITFVPAIGMGFIGLFLLLNPLLKMARPALDQLARVVAVAASSISLLLTVVLWLGFDADNTGLQFVHHTVWIRAFNIEYFLGVDGLSITMVMLTALISFIATVASLPWGIPAGDTHHFSRRSVPGYMAMLQLLQAGMYGGF
ncbi:MAG: NADH-quinone oxidoreductase subunit M, partial [Deltaproteobacteria bacterium]